MLRFIVLVEASRLAVSRLSRPPVVSRPKILVTGCFDLLTPAHWRLLEWCARLGAVQVWIDTDASIRQLGKGANRPVFSETERATVLGGCLWVAGVGLMDGPGAAAAIRRAEPDIWVKGGDYLGKDLREDELEALREVRAGLLIAPLFEGPSTTDIVERIRGAS